MLQAEVIADHTFLYVSSKHEGYTHDSTVMEGTNLYDLLSQSLLPPCAYVVGFNSYINVLSFITPILWESHPGERLVYVLPFVMPHCVLQNFVIMVSR